MLSALNEVFSARESCSVVQCCTFVPFGIKYAVKSLTTEEVHVKAAKSSAAAWVTGELVSEHGNGDRVAARMGATTSTQGSLKIFVLLM